MSSLRGVRRRAVEVDELADWPGRGGAGRALSREPHTGESATYLT